MEKELKISILKIIDKLRQAKWEITDLPIEGDATNAVGWQAFTKLEDCLEFLYRLLAETEE